MGLLNAGGAQVFEDHRDEVCHVISDFRLGALAFSGGVQVDQLVIPIHHQRAVRRQAFYREGTLLRKSSDGRAAPSAGQTYPTTFVTGMPSAVKPFRTATRTWNSAT